MDKVNVYTPYTLKASYVCFQGSFSGFGYLLDLVVTCLVNCFE